MLTVISLYLPLLLHLQNIQKFRNKFISNSSTKPNFTDIVANSGYICLHIVCDSLCFGGSSTKSNIVCLEMLVPQIQLSYLYYPHVEVITVQGSLPPACINQNK